MPNVTRTFENALSSNYQLPTAKSACLEGWGLGVGSWEFGVGRFSTDCPPSAGRLTPRGTSLGGGADASGSGQSRYWRSRFRICRYRRNVSRADSRPSSERHVVPRKVCAIMRRPFLNTKPGWSRSAVGMCRTFIQRSAFQRRNSISSASRCALRVTADVPSYSSTRVVHDEPTLAKVTCHRRSGIRRRMLNVGPVHVLSREGEIGLDRCPRVVGISDDQSADDEQAMTMKHVDRRERGVLRAAVF